MANSQWPVVMDKLSSSVWVDFFDGSIDDKFCDIREGNVTIRSEI